MHKDKERASINLSNIIHTAVLSYYYYYIYVVEVIVIVVAKYYYTGWRRSNRTFAPEFFLNGVFDLFTPKFFEIFPEVCDHPVKYVAVGKVFFRKSLKHSP